MLLSGFATGPGKRVLGPLFRRLSTCREINELDSWRVSGGDQKIFDHSSSATACSMRFALFMPPGAGACDAEKKFPIVYFLSGLTCTEQNFITKAGGQRAAARLGLIIVCPDTSPRGEEAKVEGDDESYDFGTSAGFYIDATEPKWSNNYKMETYVTSELPKIIAANFPAADTTRQSIFGHSMGGHGALTLALKNPGMYRSVSAFAPICNPTKCPWGEKAFKGYLGAVEAGAAHDACELIKSYSGPNLNLLIDQGTCDNFLTQNQLLPENFDAGCRARGIASGLRMQEGYDHSYYFISSFVEDHLEHHATHLAN